MSFPKGFLWGGSISAAQCEGGWDEGGKQDGNDGADENENIDNGITNVRE